MPEYSGIVTSPDYVDYPLGIYPDDHAAAQAFSREIGMTLVVANGPHDPMSNYALKRRDEQFGNPEFINLNQVGE